MAERITQAGGELVPFPAGTKNPWTMLRNAGRLAVLVATQGVDLVHARSRAPAWSGLLAARRTGRPFVTTYHGAYAEKGRSKQLYNSVMARGDVVIANSHYTARLIEARYGTPGERIEVIPRGVDLDTFDRARISPERIARLREGWGAPAGRPIILQAARLTSWKGQPILIDAVAKVARAGTLGDAMLVLAGDAQGREGYAASLRERARSLGIGDRVVVAGHVDDIAAAYAAAHVTVLASIEPEAFGRAAAEALAVGCPVITTDIGAPPETVLAEPGVGRSQITGWHCPPHADGLAAALQPALALPVDERERIGRRAALDMRARFTLAAMKRATLAVYDRLLATDLARRLPSAGDLPQGANGS